MKHRRCIDNANTGDLVEFKLHDGTSSRLEIMGLYYLKYHDQSLVPALRVEADTWRKYDNYFYADDVLKRCNVVGGFCIPLHSAYMPYEVLKIFKKKTT